MRALLSLFFLSLPLYVQAEVVVPIESVKSHVNIRISADAASEIVGKLQQGDSLPLVASAGEWHEVKISGGATGYIHADWTHVQDAIPVVDAKNEDQPGKPDDMDESVSSYIADEITDASAAATADSKAADAGDKSGEDDSDPVTNSEPKPELVASERQNAASDDVAGLADADDGATAAAEVAVEEVDESADEFAKAAMDSIAQVKDSKSSEAIEEIVVEVAKRDVADNTEDAQVAEDGEFAADDLEIDTNVEMTADEAVEAVASRIADERFDDGLSTIAIVRGPQGPRGAMGPPGPAGPPGSGSGGKANTARIEGSVDYLMKFSAPTVGANSQVFDDGNNVGIGTTEPKQRLEVNGNIQIHERNSSVAGLMITQASGETGYIMHNQASTLTIGAGSVDRITINRDGNVGIGVTRPAHPIEMTSGAYVSAGGVWTNSSSRSRKENIAAITPQEALAALVELQPVAFNYKNDQQEKYIGFIAEDVPDLVATNDRQSLSTMDIVAVLTKVVQEQQKKIEELEARLEQR